MPQCGPSCRRWPSCFWGFGVPGGRCRPNVESPFAGWVPQCVLRWRHSFPMWLCGFCPVWLCTRCAAGNIIAGRTPWGLFFSCGPAVSLWPAIVWNASLQWVPVIHGTFRSYWEFSLVGIHFPLWRGSSTNFPRFYWSLLAVWLVALRRIACACADAVCGVLRPAFGGAGGIFFLAWRQSCLLPPAGRAAADIPGSAMVAGRRFGRAILWVGFTLAVVLSLVSLRRTFEDGLGWSRSGGRTERHLHRTVWRRP